MIDKNFIEQPAEKYWSFPSSYPKEKRKEEVSFLIKNEITMGAIKKDEIGRASCRERVS
jgi:hypothetical protein